MFDIPDIHPEFFLLYPSQCSRLYHLANLSDLSHSVISPSLKASLLRLQRYISLHSPTGLQSNHLLERLISIYVLYKYNKKIYIGIYIYIILFYILYIYIFHFYLSHTSLYMESLGHVRSSKASVHK